ncbi:MAG: IPT/TIG domain-containing protein, partial [Herbiconiux sp.]|nr:IPT/TIG domain-containing protein [Herbiconiux sp.]
MNRGIAVQPTPRPAPRSREVLRPSGKPSLLRLLLAIATALPLFAAPVAAQAAVKLSAMSPQSGPIFGGNLVTVYGTGLDAITGVRNTTSGQSGTITEKSSTELTFRAPRANQEGGATLAFDSSEGAFQAPSNYMYYTLITSGPSPSTGPETGGTEITVLGRDLDQVISVQFSRGVGTIKRQSPTSITIVAPPTDSPYGTTVSLQFPNGYAAFPWNYDDVYTPPLVESLSPNHGSVSGGNSVTIRGQWIWGTKSVTFGTTDAPITESGNGYVTVTAPPARAGTALVKLTNREGTSVGTVYRYDPLPTPPTVSSLAPSRGPVAGGTNVVIAGANLATVTSVKFGAAAAAIVRKTAASVTVTAPAGAAGAATVTVVNPDGQATSNYTYDAPVPSDPVGPTPEPVGPTPEPVVPTPDPVGPTPEPGGSVPNPGGATPVPGGSVPEADPGTPNPGAGAP